MNQQVNERPEYAWLREFKKAHGKELLQRYGAHSIGIGWKRVAGNKSDQLALIFYVERKRPVGRLAAEPIPPTITFTPSNLDEPVLLKTDVVEVPPASFQ